MNFDMNGIADGYIMDPDVQDMDKKLKEEGKVGIVYDPSHGIENVEDPVANLPDTGVILKNVGDILEYMCKDEIVKMQKEDVDEYTKHMEGQFPDFSFKYYSLFRQVIEGEDLTHLFSMLGAIDRVKNGELTLDEAEKNLGNELGDQYIPEELRNTSDESGATPKNGGKKKKKRNRKKKKRGKR